MTAAEVHGNGDADEKTGDELGDDEAGEVTCACLPCALRAGAAGDEGSAVDVEGGDADGEDFHEEGADADASEDEVLV